MNLCTIKITMSSIMSSNGNFDKTFTFQVCLIGDETESIVKLC